MIVWMSELSADQPNNPLAAAGSATKDDGSPGRLDASRTVKVRPVTRRTVLITS